MLGAIINAYIFGHMAVLQNTCGENNSTKDVTELTSESHDVDGRHNHARYLKY